MTDVWNVTPYRTVSMWQGSKEGAQGGSPVGEGGGSLPVPEVTGREVLPSPGPGKPEDGRDKRNGGNFDKYECQTCKNRKYQDGSDDPGVSFKTPTALNPEEAPSAVRSHENEHVTRERAAAAREGREVVSQSVTYHSAVCPECGRVYMSGGTTRTVTKKQVDEAYGLEREEKGRYLDKTA